MTSQAPSGPKGRYKNNFFHLQGSVLVYGISLVGDVVVVVSSPASMHPAPTLDMSCKSHHISSIDNQINFVLCPCDHP